MIEVPRGALTADEIAETAEFFSFGTNDLTQTALGMSRDDSGSFLPHYAELEIVKRNPFATIDQDGVGQLMQIAVEKGRKTRPKIKLGICGEHGGDPDSVKFCHRLGLDYVSCSPFVCRSRVWPRPRRRLLSYLARFDDVIPSVVEESFALTGQRCLGPARHDKGSMRHTLSRARLGDGFAPGIPRLSLGMTVLVSFIKNPHPCSSRTLSMPSKRSPISR